MQNYIPDPYQHRLMGEEITSLSVYISGSEGTGKFSTILKMMYSDFQEGKNTIILFQDSSHLKHMIRAIQASGMAAFCGIFETSHSFDVEQIARIRAIEKSEKSEENTGNAIEIAYDFQHLREETLENFEKLSAPFFGQMNWSQLVQQYQLATAVCPDHIIDARLLDCEYEYSKNEYWLIKGRIEKAAERFMPEFMFREKIFRDEIFLALDHPAKLELIADILSGFEKKLRKQTSDLKIFFRRKMSEIESKLENELAGVWNEFKNLTRNINLYFSKEEQYVKELKLFGFGQKYRAENKLALQAIHEQLVHLKKLIERSEWLNIPTHDFPEILTDEILQSDVFESINEIQQNKIGMIDRELRFRIRRMNFQNQQDETIENLDAQIEELISALNRSKLFYQKFEMHALNIHAKYIQLDEISSIVHKGMSCLKNDKAYFSWMHIWVNLPEKTRNIIYQLHDLDPGKWVKAFDRWYLYHVLKMHSPELGLLNEDSLNRYLELKQVHEKHMKQEEYEGFRHRAQDAIKTLRTRHSAVYKSIFKKQLDSLDYYNLLGKNQSFIQGVFPISIVDAKLLTQFKEPVDLRFDNVVYYHLEASGIKNVRFNMDARLYHVIKNINGTLPAGTSLVDLQIPYPSEWVSLKDTSPGKVLNQARYFAHALCALNVHFVCYLTKDETMISFLPEVYNRQLLYEYEDSGIKQFHVDQDPVEQLTECFLRKEDQKSIHILDGLFSAADYPFLDWQLELAAQCKAAGIHVVQHWSGKLFRKEQTELDGSIENTKTQPA